ncbi:protein of unknown function [Methylocella tundrae]|uniref:Uncharacterized protein n=1 Tax=Methylocella tundrae TaxID=227605 RepID=A0A4U8YZU0_METTU|nr:protein of unknown function [Methylocella tundrae]
MFKLFKPGQFPSRLAPTDAFTTKSIAAKSIA